MLQPVDIEVANDQGDADVALSLYSEALADPSIDLILGPHTSELATVLLPLFQNLSRPFISCCVGAPQLFMPQGNLFSLLPTANVYFARMLQVLASRGLQTATLLKDQDSLFYTAACNQDTLPVLQYQAGDVTKRIEVTGTYDLPPPDARGPDAVPGIVDGMVNTIVQTNADIVVACFQSTLCEDLSLELASRQFSVPATLFGLCATAPTYESRLFDPDTDPLLQGGLFTIGIPSLAEVDNDILYANGKPSYCNAGKPCWGALDLEAYGAQKYGSWPGPRAGYSFGAVQIGLQYAQRKEIYPGLAAKRLMRELLFPTVLGDVQFSETGAWSAQVLYQQYLPPDGDGLLVSPDWLAVGVLVPVAPSWEERMCIVEDGCGGNGVCQRDGSCKCDSGFIGAGCGIPVAVVIVVPLLVLMCCIAGLGFITRKQRRNAKSASLQLAHQRQERQIAEDITRTTMERALAYALHELGNPVHAVMGASELLRDDITSGEPELAQQLILVGMIRRAGFRMNRVLEDMRHPDDEADLPQIAPESAEISGILRDVRLRMATVFSVYVTALPDPVSVPNRVVLDELRVRQMLLACLAHVSTVADQKGSTSAKMAPTASARRLRHRFKLGRHRGQRASQATLAAAGPDSVALQLGTPGSNENSEDSVLEGRTPRAQLPPHDDATLAASSLDSVLNPGADMPLSQRQALMSLPLCLTVHVQHIEHRLLQVLQALDGPLDPEDETQVRHITSRVLGHDHAMQHGTLMQRFRRRGVSAASTHASCESNEIGFSQRSLPVAEYSQYLVFVMEPKSAVLDQLGPKAASLLACRQVPDQDLSLRGALSYAASPTAGGDSTSLFPQITPRVAPTAHASNMDPSMGVVTDPQLVTAGPQMPLPWQSKRAAVSTLAREWLLWQAIDISHAPGIHLPFRHQQIQGCLRYVAARLPAPHTRGGLTSRGRQSVIVDSRTMPDSVGAQVTRSAASRTPHSRQLSDSQVLHMQQTSGAGPIATESPSKPRRTMSDQCSASQSAIPEDQTALPRDTQRNVHAAQRVALQAFTMGMSACQHLATHLGGAVVYQDGSHPNAVLILPLRRASSESSGSVTIGQRTTTERALSGATTGLTRTRALSSVPSMSISNQPQDMDLSKGLGPDLQENLPDQAAHVDDSCSPVAEAAAEASAAVTAATEYMTPTWQPHEASAAHSRLLLHSALPATHPSFTDHAGDTAERPSEALLEERLCRFGRHLATQDSNSGNGLRSSTDSQTAPAASARAATAPQPRPADATTVMVVDDERANVRLTCAMLARMGYETIRCYDGDEVIDALQSAACPVSLVLLDIVMKRSNGITTARELREAGYNMPIIAMTANVQPKDLAQYDAAGFDGVLGKPFSRAHLLSTCQEHMHGSCAGSTPALEE